MKMGTGAIIGSIGALGIAGQLYAQQSKPSPELEAIGSKLMQEINANIQCNANAIAGRAELEKLQAELKAVKQELADAKQKSSSGKTDGGSGAQPEVR